VFQDPFAAGRFGVDARTINSRINYQVLRKITGLVYFFVENTAIEVSDRRVREFFIDVYLGITLYCYMVEK